MRDETKLVTLRFEALEEARARFEDLAREFVRGEELQDLMRTCPETAPDELKDIARAIATAPHRYGSNRARRYMRLVGAEKMRASEIPVSSFMRMIKSEIFGA